MSHRVAVMLMLIVCSVPGYAQQAQIRETKQNFKTYPYSDPDPVARPGRLYPYFRFDGYTTTPRQQEWKVIEMENDFIRIAITPEIGGKVWSAYEKSKNFPIIFSNKVVMFRDIAMRGAWTSGGMEFNFGDIGHAPTTSTPVDYFTRTNPDGSVSCFIGATEWSARTTWRVEIKLYPDKAYFMTRAWWYNNTPFETSYYNWTNTGVNTSGNLEYVFPGSHFIGHVGEFDTFPTDSVGRNLSYYDKGTFGSFKSYHVLGQVTDFYGGYWHDYNMGLGHYSPYQEKMGKKAWSWGLAREGLVWDKLLTETDGPNVELQSGRLFNQASPASMFTPFKHVSFTPYTTDSWSEYWYPVKNTGGLTQGSLKGALNLRAENGWLKFDWMALEPQSDTLSITTKDIVLYNHNLKLATMGLFRDSVKWEGDIRDLTVLIGDDEFIGKTQRPVSRPLEAPENFDWDSEYGLQLRGEDLANQREYAKAAGYLEKALAKNPNLIPALSQLAQIHYRQGELTKARELLLRALSVNTYDPRTNYLWGMLNLETDSVADALDGFAVALLAPAYRSSSLAKMAAIHVRENNWKKAGDLVSAALAADHRNAEASNLYDIILRNTGQRDVVLKRILQELEFNPLDHYARFEKFMTSGSDQDQNEYVSMIRQELPHETFLEMAIHYYRLKLYKEALAILSLSPKQAMVQLWQAFIQSKTGADAGASFDAYVNASPALVFPFRTESLEPLEWARQRKAHWKTNYYTALILWQSNRKDEAKSLFEACGDQPDYAPFYLAKAELLQEDASAVKKALEKAYQVDSKGRRPIARLAQFYASHDQPKEALVLAQKNQQINAGYVTELQYAQMLIRNKQYAKGLAILDKVVMLPAELDMDAPILFKQANVAYALEQMGKKRWKDAINLLRKAETWPENLGAGEPYFPDNRATRFLMAYCYNQLKDSRRESESLAYVKEYKNSDKDSFDPANERLSELLKSGTTDYKKILAELTTIENTRIPYYKMLNELLAK